MKINIQFFSKPNDFTFDEMNKLLNGFGYREIKSGITSGSRIAFMNTKTKHIIRLHKPNPQKNMKRYQLDFIEKDLRSKEILK